MQKQKVVIDTDPGIDDSLAILAALNSPELDVIGISIVEGNVPTTIGVQNALKILREANRLDVPIYSGASKPLKHDYVSAQDTHGNDGLGNSHLTDVLGIDTYDLIQDKGYEELFAQQDICFLALGPLTNVAYSIQTQPEIWRDVSRIVIMGGAYQTQGNSSPVAEYNFWVDPDAAEYVIQSNICKIDVVPLDVTRKIVLTPNILQIMKYMNPQKTKFIHQIIQFYFDFHWQQEHVLGAVINDPLVIAYILDPTIAIGYEFYMTIVTEGKALGQSIVDSASFLKCQPNVTLLQQVDAKRAMAIIISRLIRVDQEALLKDLDHVAQELEAM
ncbi:nucleoside hydrolase [Leuconostoc palmae]|uniref:nucleoside hydrolase n=1 Tax=Leuconostoc palmae TaxID=501487 RepID=UPI001C7D7D3D|nr:nucleoside hydrolase [Leuconostoc palmae]